MTFASISSSPSFLRSATRTSGGRNRCGALRRRGARTRRGPRAQPRNRLGAGLRERNGSARGGFDVARHEIPAGGERFVHSFDDRRLDLRAGESFGRGGKSLEIELRGVALLLAEVDLEDAFALGRIGKVDEEDLVEAALAQKLGRKILDLVRGRYDEDGLGLLLQPGEESAEHARGRSRVARAAAGDTRETLLDLVEPEHAGGERFRDAD